VVGLAEFLTGALQAVDDLVVGVVRDLERDVVEVADHRRLLRDHQLVDVRIGECEERERPAVAHGEEGVAHRHLPVQPGIVVALAPGRDERNAQQVLEELPVLLLVAHDIGVVMQPLRQFVQQLWLVPNSFGH
jgi:hypothetical protein